MFQQHVLGWLAEGDLPAGQSPQGSMVGDVLGKPTLLSRRAKSSSGAASKDPRRLKDGLERSQALLQGLF